MATDSKYEYIGNGSPDGVILGQTVTEKIGFYGHAPIVSGTISASAGTDAATLAVELTEIRAWLVEIGLIVA